MVRFIALIFFMSGICVSNEAHAEAVVGKWCVSLIPNTNTQNAVYEIVVISAKKSELRRKFYDGSSGTVQLQKIDRRNFREIKSASGDEYRIQKSTGILQVLDDIGLVMTGRKMKSGEPNNACIKQ
jgi:hypothetical protein